MYKNVVLKTYSAICHPDSIAEIIAGGSRTRSARTFDTLTEARQDARENGGSCCRYYYDRNGNFNGIRYF